MQKNFSYPIKIDDLSQNEQFYHLQADEDERADICAVLKTQDVKYFCADIFLKLNRKMHRLDIKGEIRAILELKSVISLENFEKEYVVPFKYYYDTALKYEDIRQMDEDIYSEVPEIIENGQIDLGLIAIEQVSLVMEDYPRKEGEKFENFLEFDERENLSSNPFRVLEKLKK